MSKEIIVTKRTDDYHACLKDHPEMWGCGRNAGGAIGNLIASHGITFDIGIAYDYPNSYDAFLKRHPEFKYKDTKPIAPIIVAKEY